MSTVVASKLDMEKLVNASFGDHMVEPPIVSDLPWSDEEELVAGIESTAGLGRKMVRLLACFAVLVSSAGGLIEISRRRQRPLYGGRFAAAKGELIHFT